MQYLYYFSISNIPYKIYKLQPGDKIMCLEKNNLSKSFLIIEGIILLTKFLNYNKNIPLGIINQNHIIDFKKLDYTTIYFYQIEALKTSYILTFSHHDLYYQYNLPNKLLICIISSYRKTIERYNQMTYILSHKYIRYRLIQFILFLANNFGIIYNKNIRIPLKLSKCKIGIILGCNSNTIYTTILKNYPHIIIRYSNTKNIYIHNIINLIHVYCY